MSATPAARINWTKWTVVRTSRATATRTAPKARLNVPSASEHARLFQLVRVLASLSKCGRKSGFSPGVAEGLWALTLALKQPRMQIVLSPISSQQMPAGHRLAEGVLDEAKDDREGGARGLSFGSCIDRLKGFMHGIEFAAGRLCRR